MSLVAFLLKLARASSCLLLVMAVSGCQFFDKATYEPRSYEMNLGTQTLREELILLNVVRASRLEPLNFTTLSKYTANGTFTAGGTGSKNLGIDFTLFNPTGSKPTNFSAVGSSPANTIGGSIGSSTGNSFDVAPLDNNDFYQNFLNTLTPQNVNLLVNAGLSREVVFYSVLRAIDINLTDAGQARAGYRRLRFVNDPTNDIWTIERNNSKNDPVTCKSEAERDREIGLERSTFSPKIWAPFQTDYWLGKHATDCSYHKFLMLIEQALRYGVTTKVVSSNSQGTSKQQAIPLPKIARDRAAPPTVIVVNAGAPSAAGSGSRTLGASDQNVILCFDPTIAAYSGIRISNKATACPDAKGRETALEQMPLPTHLGPYDESMDPILRSPYAVFQYYGKLLRTHTQVEVSQIAEMRTDSWRLFDVRDDLSACFVGVTYEGQSYCVPQADAGNTKEVLQILIALVNLSTVRSSLPTTQSVISQPQ